MSADSYLDCPKCHGVPRDAQDKLEQAESGLEKAKNQYGKISADEYISGRELARIELNNAIDAAHQETSVRSYHEIYITGKGEFYIRYEGSCDLCDFKHEFKHSEQLKWS